MPLHVITVSYMCQPCMGHKQAEIQLQETYMRAHTSYASLVTVFLPDVSPCGTEMSR